MSEIEQLTRNYERFVRIPWQDGIAGPQKVWFAVYDPAQERRLRLRVAEFEIATEKAGKTWLLIDLSNSFAEWMGTHRYRETYFEEPENLSAAALTAYMDYVSEQLNQALTSSQADENTVVAILGIGSLFGLARASIIIETIAHTIQGRLLVFFPGEYENNNYRMLDARDGWNYLAIPITA